MELGGKDAAIVCADADIELAAKHIVKGAFSYSGQRCTGARAAPGRQRRRQCRAAPPPHTPHPRPTTPHHTTPARHNYNRLWLKCP